MNSLHSKRAASSPNRGSRGSESTFSLTSHSGEYTPVQYPTMDGAFPDPSSSPGHHTRYLLISDPVAVTSPRIRSFCHLQELTVSAIYWKDTSGASFVELHGLSPTLKSLRMITSTTPPSKILDLICSFPLSRTWYCITRSPKATVMNGSPLQPHQNSLGSST